MDQPHASLTIVTGRPGSGKTTLSQALARGIRCPLISRDEIKEGVVHSLAHAEAASQDEVNRLANRAFFEATELLLRHGVTLVIEAAFQHRLWAPHVERLSAMASTRIVICAIDPALARARHIERGLADPERERFHVDDVMRAAREGQQLPLSDYVPPAFDVPTLVVDATADYQPEFDAIMNFARSASR